MEARPRPRWRSGRRTRPRPYRPRASRRRQTSETSWRGTSSVRSTESVVELSRRLGNRLPPPGHHVVVVDSLPCRHRPAHGFDEANRGTWDGFLATHTSRPRGLRGVRAAVGSATLGRCSSGGLRMGAPTGSASRRPVWPTMHGECPSGPLTGHFRGIRRQRGGISVRRCQRPGMNMWRAPFTASIISGSETGRRGRDGTRLRHRAQAWRDDRLGLPLASAPILCGPCRFRR